MPKSAYMRKIILKAIALIAIWVISYGLVYIVSILVGRDEVSNWGFYLTVGLTVTYGFKISDYIVRKILKS